MPPPLDPPLKPHTNAFCATIYCKIEFYNISCGTWCASKSHIKRVPTDVAMNLLTMRDSHCETREGGFTMAAASAWLWAQEQSFYCSGCTRQSFTVTVQFICTLFVKHVYCSLATSWKSCNQLTQTRMIWRFILIVTVYIYARQGVDPSSPIGRLYNHSWIVLLCNWTFLKNVALNIPHNGQHLLNLYSSPIARIKEQLVINRNFYLNIFVTGVSNSQKSNLNTTSKSTYTHNCSF